MGSLATIAPSVYSAVAVPPSADRPSDRCRGRVTLAKFDDGLVLARL